MAYTIPPHLRASASSNCLHDFAWKPFGERTVDPRRLTVMTSPRSTPRASPHPADPLAAMGTSENVDKPQADNTNDAPDAKPPNPCDISAAVQSIRLGNMGSLAPQLEDGGTSDRPSQPSRDIFAQASFAAEAFSAEQLQNQTHEGEYNQQALGPSPFQDEASIPQLPEQNSSADLGPFDYMGNPIQNGMPDLFGPVIDHDIAFNAQEIMDHLNAIQANALQDIPYQQLQKESKFYQEIDESTISAYAKISFDDGVYFMNTFSVILGRDQIAFSAAVKRDKFLERSGQIEGQSHSRTPPRRYKASIISEKSGFMRNGEDESPEQIEARRIRKASKKSKSTGSSSRSQHEGRPNRVSKPKSGVTRRYSAQNLREQAAAPVDPSGLHPNPYECPLIPIHPGANAHAEVYKKISKRHLKIGFNHNKLVWEAKVLGRNGAFVDGEFREVGQVIPLKTNTLLQIGPIPFTFILPDNYPDESMEADDAPSSPVVDRYYEGGKEMSFTFEDTPREGVFQDTSEEESDGDVEQNGNQEDGQQESREGSEEGSSQNNRQSSQESNSRNGQQEASSPVSAENIQEEDNGWDNTVLESREKSPTAQNDDKPTGSKKKSPQKAGTEKKRGPGRPPKNGIMSKREEQLAKREALAQAQQKAGGKPTSPPKKTDAAGNPIPGKNKVGRPRKHPLPETPAVPREKRKYTKRKPKEPKEGESKPEDDKAKSEEDSKDQKPALPPRSPTPEWNESNTTYEERQKPPKNYVAMIFEAIESSPTGVMDLSSIYHFMKKKYPYFVVSTQTHGWQSSVRHNLGQNIIFERVMGEKQGKGTLWRITEGASIEREKKKKQAAQQTQPQPVYPYPQPIQQASYPPGYIPNYPPGDPNFPPGPPPPGYPQMIPGQPYPPGNMGPPPNYPPNSQPPPEYQNQQRMSPYPPPNGQMPPGQYFQPPNPYLPSRLPIAPELVAPHNPAQYSSPYAKPPAQSQSQPNGQSTSPLVQNQSQSTGQPAPTQLQNQPQPNGQTAAPQQPQPVQGPQPSWQSTAPQQPRAVEAPANGQPPATQQQQSIQSPPQPVTANQPAVMQPHIQQQQAKQPQPQPQQAQAPHQPVPQQPQRPQELREPPKLQHAQQTQQPQMTQLVQQPNPTPVSRVAEKPHQQDRTTNPNAPRAPQPPASAQIRQQPDDKLEFACQIFKTALMKTMDPKIEDLIDYVINEVLNRPNKSLSDFSRQQIQRIPQLKTGLYDMFGKLGGEGSAIPPRENDERFAPPAPASQTSGNKAATSQQPSSSNGTARRPGMFARPTFATTKPNFPIPRPPMRGSASSVGNASARSSVQSPSPAPLPVPSPSVALDANTSKPVQNFVSNGFLAAPADVTDLPNGMNVPIKEKGKENVPFLYSAVVKIPSPPLDMNVNVPVAQMTSQPTDNVHNSVNVSSTPISQMAGQKRSRDDEGDKDEMREFKRLETASGSQPVKA